MILDLFFFLAGQRALSLLLASSLLLLAVGCLQRIGVTFTVGKQYDCLIHSLWNNSIRVALCDGLLV